MGKVYLFLAEGFEEIEALTTVDLCRRAGIDIVTVTITEEHRVTGSHGIIVEADVLFKDQDFSDQAMLVLPGGGKGTANLEAFGPLAELLRKSAAEGRLISAICAAPRILGKLGLLENEEACCYPGFEKELKCAKVLEQPAVRSGNFITGRGMGCSMEFGLMILERLVGAEKAGEIKKQVIFNH